MEGLPNRPLAGQVALITGASQGIGAAVARCFAQAGARLVLNARNEQRLATVAADIAGAGGEVRTLAADIAAADSAPALAALAEQAFGGLQILVHNAGIFPYQPLAEMAFADWQRVLDVNLNSAFRLLSACLPLLRRNPASRVIFVSSVQGNRVAVPGCAHYAASKAGLNGLMRAAALELAADGITVNCVEPGLVRTPGVEDALSARRRAAMAAEVPLGRWAEADEVAQAVLYLASPQAGYVTGHSLVIDGGALLPLGGVTSS
ncbi:MAG: SDR family oxidoreductase [Gammaproteobacteria bacterium]|nr:MAG: SDR family oxidoreductase [Gammaproteobacteria bacterium]